MLITLGNKGLMRYPAPAFQCESNNLKLQTRALQSSPISFLLSGGYYPGGGGGGYSHI